MEGSDYFLQYCLYAVALKRYLERKYPTDDYYQYFGGAFYLFIRGINPRGQGGNILRSSEPGTIGCSRRSVSGTMNSIQPDQLERALRYEPFAASDRVFCRLLKESFSEENAFVLAAASLCLSAVREGHSFFDLASPELPELLCEALENAWPTVAEWAPIAKSSHSIGRPGDDNPLILDGESALYLHRYFTYETELANKVSIKASQLVPASLAYAHSSLISESMQAEAVEKDK